MQTHFKIPGWQGHNEWSRLEVSRENPFIPKCMIVFAPQKQWHLRVGKEYEHLA